jgi:hypothetical protein
LRKGILMKRLVLGLVVTVFSFQAIGCDSGGPAASPAPAGGEPGGGPPPKAAGDATKGVTGPANPIGPKNDR